MESHGSRDAGGDLDSCADFFEMDNGTDREKDWSGVA